MPFAILVNGSPVEIPPGQPFATTQFRVKTPAEAAWSLSPVGSVIEHHVNHPGNALELWDGVDLDRFQVYSFVAPVPPDGKRLESHALALVNGAVVATGVFADPVVPDEVLRVQGRLQLIAEGLLPTIEAAVAGADAATKEYWASTAVFRRHNPILTGMWAALGRSPAQLDATFTAAAKIPT